MKIVYTTTGVHITPYMKNQNKGFEISNGVYDKIRHQNNLLTAYYDGKSNMLGTYKHKEYFLKECFPKYEVEYMKPSKGRSISGFEIDENFELRDNQKDIVSQYLNLNSNQAFINVGTGVGKTIMAIYIASMLQKRTFIMCFKTSILDQWLESLKEFSNIDMSKVIFIKKSEILEKMIAEGSDYDIYICTIDLIMSFVRRNDAYKLMLLFNKLGIGLKIFDEAHREFQNICAINAFTNVERTIYLSADFTQANRFKKVLFYHMFYGVPVITIDKEEIKQNAYIDAYVVEYQSGPNLNEEVQVSSATKYGFSIQKFMEYQFTKNYLYDSICSILHTVEKYNHKILVLVTLIEHVDTLHRRLSAEFPNISIGKYHSQMDSSEKDNTKDNARIIVSTYQSFSTGMDVLDIRDVISCAPVDPITDNQASGRARRPDDGGSCRYWMLTDIDFAYCINKNQRRLSYIQKQKIRDVYKIKNPMEILK